MDKEEVMSSEDKEDFDYVMESLFRTYHNRLGKNEHQKKADIRSMESTVGQYAFRELLGMIEALQKIGYINSDLKDTNYMSYNCENQEYHLDYIPLDWLNGNKTSESKSKRLKNET